ncbi:hypothetical protein FRC11_007855, partial [Ceratobasidium sp. 423]
MSFTPTPKRSRPFLHISDSLLFSGGGRNKRARSGSRSGSPTDSGVPTLGVTNLHGNAQTITYGNRLSPAGSSGRPSPDPSAYVQDDRNLFPRALTHDPPVITIESTPTKSTNRAIWAKLERALHALHITTKVCPPLHSAVDNLKSCLHLFEEVAKSSEDYAELGNGLKVMVELLNKHLPDAASQDIMDTVTNIAKKITREVESIGEGQPRSEACRMLGGLRDEDDLIRRYRRIEQLFRQLQGEASMGSWTASCKHLINTQLESLRPVKYASFDSELSTDIGRRPCTGNTRVKILGDSLAWADDPNGAKVYWMNGMAGTGKTTIAYSFCEALEAAGQLAASFFCTRTSPDCRDAKRIVPTIAYQLARQSAPFRRSLCGVLDEDPDIGTRNPSKQFEHLFSRPLLKAQEIIANNLVVVIDALDECSDPHVVEVVLALLFQFAPTCPVKFFVTSRPEPAIRNSMLSGIAEHNRSHSILHLHEIEKSLVQADIELYLKDELEDILPGHYADVEYLAELAGNLFIYAATVVRYIKATGTAASSKQRLKTILTFGNKANKSLSGIDKLYSAVLSAAINNEDLEAEEQNTVKVVLWTTVCVHEPLTIDTLACLSGLDEVDLAVSALQPLRSVLHVSEHSNLVTTLHASFPDYIFSPDRSQAFFCERSSHGLFLANSCLGIMKAQLRFNICRIESSFFLDEEISDLKERVDDVVSPELWYACRFWADHLSQAGASSSLFEMVHEFLSKKLLFWMEVLNLRKCMVTGAAASTIAHMWLKTSEAPPALIALAHDAQTFVGNYATHNISSSTPHIYISALPFSSPTSLIRSTYQPRFTGLVQATGTLMDQIDQASLEVWSSKVPIRSASFSTDRKHVGIGDDNGNIAIQDPHSGKCITSFKAHRKVISSIAFSSDGTMIVSSSHDHTLCIWSVRDGSLVSGPFKGHQYRVNSVVFSPDGRRLASGSEDCTIRTWAVRDPSCFQLQLTGHFAAVHSVTFSPDGLQLASGSNDFTIRIWDGLTGTLLHILEGHTHFVTCVRFSPCGTLIFSGSNDCTIRTWDTYDGTPVGSSFKDDSGRITAIAVSPEGKRIASGSLDRTVRVWHGSSGELVAGPFKGHTDSVRSVEFSADGARIISASDDKTVRVWNAQGRTRSNAMPGPLEGTSEIAMTTISPDGSQVASGHTDGTIRFWDVLSTTRESVSSSQYPEDEDKNKNKDQGEGEDVYFDMSKYKYKPGPKPLLLLLTFSLDGKHLHAAYNNGILRTLYFSDGELFESRCDYSPWARRIKIAERPIALSPDGGSAISTRLRDALDMSIAPLDLWDLRAKQRVCTIQPTDNDSRFLEAVFPSDASSTLLATGTEKGVIELWDRHNGQRIGGPFRP